MIYETSAMDKCFQFLVSDMQSFSPLLEDAILKGTKMHTHFKTLLQSYSAFWESMHKLADLGAQSQGCGKPMGACLSRLCTKMTSQELKLRQMCNHLLSSTLQPLQDQLDDWKKQVSQLEKDHHKELKAGRSNTKRAAYEWQRLQKKAGHTGGGKGMPGPPADQQALTSGGEMSRRCSMPSTAMPQLLIGSGRGDGKKMQVVWQEYAKQSQALHQQQRDFLRRAMLMDRQRYVTLWQCLRPLMDSLVSSLEEMCHLQENVTNLNTLTVSLQQDSSVEERLNDLSRHSVLNADDSGVTTTSESSDTALSAVYDRLSLSSGSNASGRCAFGGGIMSVGGQHGTTLGPASRHSSTTSLTSYHSAASSAGANSAGTASAGGNHSLITGSVAAVASLGHKTGSIALQKAAFAECRAGGNVAVQNLFSSVRVPSLTSQDSGIASNRDPEYAVGGVLLSQSSVSGASSQALRAGEFPHGDSQTDARGHTSASEEDEEEEDDEDNSSDTDGELLDGSVATAAPSLHLGTGTVRSLRDCSHAIQSLEAAAAARHTISASSGRQWSGGVDRPTRPSLSAATFQNPEDEVEIRQRKMSATEPAYHPHVHRVSATSALLTEMQQSVAYQQQQNHQPEGIAASRNITNSNSNSTNNSTRNSTTLIHCPPSAAQEHQHHGEDVNRELQLTLHNIISADPNLPSPPSSPVMPLMNEASIVALRHSPQNTRVGGAARKPPPPVRRGSQTSLAGMLMASPALMRRGSCMAPSTSKIGDFSEGGTALKSVMGLPPVADMNDMLAGSSFETVGRPHTSLEHYASMTMSRHQRSSTHMMPSSGGKPMSGLPSPFQRQSVGGESPASKSNFLAELKLAQQSRTATATTASVPPPPQVAPPPPPSPAIPQESPTTLSSTNDESDNPFLAALRSTARQLKHAAVVNDRSAPAILP